LELRRQSTIVSLLKEMEKAGGVECGACDSGAASVALIILP